MFEVSPEALAKKNVVAVGRGTRRRLRAQNAGRARDVLDEHRLPERARDAVGQEPRHDVGGKPGPVATISLIGRVGQEWCWRGLCTRAIGREQQQGARHHAQKPSHEILPHAAPVFWLH